MKLFWFCILSAILFPACDLITDESYKKSPDPFIINESIDTSTTNYHKPIIFGTLKNIGNSPARNCIVQAIAYKNNIVVDFATDFISGGIEIPSLHYEAFTIIFTDLSNHFDYDRYVLQITYFDACGVFPNSSTGRTDIIINELIDTSTTSYHRPAIFGTLKNTSNVTIYNCIVKATAYKNNTIVDFATDLIRGGIYIQQCQYESFTIVFLNLRTHSDYDRYELQTTFLTK